MPGDCLSFTVFISRKPDGVGFFDGFFEFSDNLFLFGVHFIGGREAMLDINRWSAILGLLGNRAYMTNTRKDSEFFAEVFFDGLGLCGALYDDEVFAHGM